VYAQGITATADKTFSNIIYQTVTDEDKFTYLHVVKTNLETPFGFNSVPEKCIWSINKKKSSRAR
jgi:hypothetical protein